MTRSIISKKKLLTSIWCWTEYLPHANIYYEAYKYHPFNEITLKMTPRHYTMVIWFREKFSDFDNHSLIQNHFETFLIAMM